MTTRNRIVFFLWLLVQLAEATIVELDHLNLADAFQQRPWICVLFYDRNDPVNTPRHQSVLENMEERSNDIVTFAQLDMRQHWLYRQVYVHPNVVDKLVKGYLHDVYSDPSGFLVLQPETLLNFQLGEVYFPAKLCLFQSDYSAQDAKDLTMFNTVSLPLQAIHLERWVHDSVTTSKDLPIQKSNPHVERDRDAEYDQFKDNSFDFEAYDLEFGVDEELEALGLGEEEMDIRYLLEMGAPLDMNHRVITPYIHAKVTMDHSKPGKANYYLSMLGKMTDVTLAWIEGYEFSWSEERKQREDEATNFGAHLETLNKDLRALIDQVLDENVKSRTAPFFQKKLQSDPEWARQMEVPNLRPYLLEVVFGMGRSASNLREILKDMADTMGATAKERRQNRHLFNGTEFPLVNRMREYMEVYVQAYQDEKRFSLVLQELVGAWQNLVSDFHKNLSDSYEHFLQTRTRSNKNVFQTMPMDVLDMESPTDYDTLTDYDAFHKKYTETGTPVVLANVNMTNEPFTLEHIVELCSSMDVTESVKLSQRVAKDQAPLEWGGLRPFELDDTLLNDKRKEKEFTFPSSSRAESPQPPRSYQDDDGNEQEKVKGSTKTDGKETEKLGDYGQLLGEDGIDRSLTMEQFAILHKNLPEFLYLHDQGIPDECDRLLYDETIYDRNQKFRIPSVIGSYDLFQRVQQSSYANTWPSLFVGRKGSNSKIHIDSGATGFYMFLVSGRKRWIVYNRNERPFLYEDLEGGHFIADVLGMGKSNEANDFLSTRFPLLHRAESAYEMIQEPGQLVYIPPNCPHAVENLEDTIGLAMNFVSKSGTANHIQDQLLVKQVHYVFQVAMTYLLFEEGADKPFPTEDPLYTTFGEFKAQY